MSKAIREIVKVFPAFAPQLLVDVGANVGRSTRELLDVAGSDATVFAFEPITRSFQQLQEAVAGHSQVVTEQACLGSVEGSVLMTARGTANGNRIVAEGEVRGGTEVVPMIRGDAYFRSRGIETIDLFKTSTNGWDLDVLVGMVDYLASQRIRTLQVVTAMTPGETRACPFEKMTAFLEPFGYGVLGFVSPVRTDEAGNARASIALVDTIYIAE
jgi:FkbM family methyltransferase